MHPTLRVLVVMPLCFISARAYAFAEDVCFPAGGPPQNCSTLPDLCLPIGTDDEACRAAATRVFVMEGSASSGARSTIHADATHLLAQFCGFSADRAYWIAGYDEVADYGVFEPLDLAGAQVDGGALRTATLDGYVRTSLSTGGLLFHFMAPYNGGVASPPSGLDGLSPAFDDGHTELQLANTRAWALGLAPGCTGGVTMPTAGDYATGAACYTEGGAAVPIDGTIRAVADTDLAFHTETGLQIIATGDDTIVRSDAFESTVGAAHADDARLGIYLHSLADRVSHHVCTDQSFVTGPTDGFDYDIMAEECAQGYHALRHMWETGVAPDLLAERDRTTHAALSIVLDELRVFAEVRGVLDARAADATQRDALLAGIEAALAEPDGEQRLLAIAALACAGGFEPFPGMPACAEDSGGDDSGDTDDTDADTDADTDTDAGEDGCGCGAGPARGGALALAALLAAVLRRGGRRRA